MLLQDACKLFHILQEKLHFSARLARFSVRSCNSCKKNAYKICIYLARRFLLDYAGGVPGGFSRLPRSTEGSDNCDNCVAIQDFELCHSTSIPREATLCVLGYSQAGGYEGGYMR